MNEQDSGHIPGYEVEEPLTMCNIIARFSCSIGEEKNQKSNTQRFGRYVLLDITEWQTVGESCAVHSTHPQPGANGYA